MLQTPIFESEVSERLSQPGVAVGLAWTLPAASGTWWWLQLGAVLGCIGYVIFMFRVDVPMYLARWREGQESGATYMGIAEGFGDAWSRREPTQSWAVWQPEVAWLSGYFSFAVWTSIALVWIPRV